MLKTLSQICFMIFLCSTFSIIFAPKAKGLEYVKTGQTTENRGWGRSTTSMFEEFWSYMIHGHGVRHHKDTYKAIGDDAGTESFVDSDDNSNDSGDSSHGSKGFDGDGDGDGGNAFWNPDTGPSDSPGAPVPEPCTFLLMILGSGLIFMKKRLRGRAKM